MDLHARLEAANAAARSVGAIACASVDGEILDAATGIADVRTAIPVTPATPFRLGSIAKVCTATVLTELLAESGRSLDEPVDLLLPGCPPAEVADRLTWRHVLQHRSGIDGTYWEGFGDGPDAIRAYAAAVADLPLVFQPGDSWGYSNSAFVLAGAAIEALSGLTYERAVRERLLDPLGLASTSLWSERTPPNAATGHHPAADGPRAADAPSGLRALAPAGATAFSTARDALALADGLLSGAWADLAAAATPMPPGDGRAATHQSLGWRVHQWSGTTVFGHDGGSAGMGSFVRWVPERRTGFALLGNTNPSALLVWADLSAWFFDEVGIVVPPDPTPSEDAAAETAWCGEYRCRDATFTVKRADDELTLAVDGFGGTLQRTATLEPLSPGVYRADAIVTDPARIVSFERPRDAYRVLHSGPFTARADA